jgi:hypothetical protein
VDVCTNNDNRGYKQGTQTRYQMKVVQRLDESRKLIDVSGSVFWPENISTQILLCRIQTAAPPFDKDGSLYQGMNGVYGEG